MLDRVVREAASRHGDRIALAMAPVGRDDPAAYLSAPSMSYRQLDRESDIVAAGLRAAGVRAGDVVAVVLPAGFDYVTAYVATAKVGAICAGVNPKLAQPEQAALVERVAPSLVVDGALPRGAAVGSIGDPGDDPEREVAIVFTSGTTGLPRGAVFRSRQLQAVTTIDLGAATSAWTGGGGPMLASTQLPHVGFMTKLPWYLSTGSTIWILPTWRADDVLRLVAATRMTTIGGVAPQIALLMRSPLLEHLDLSCVSQFVVGGALSTPALVQAARDRFGADYSIRYSSTESGGVGLGTAAGADEYEVLHTIGRPRPGVDAKVIDEDGAQTAAGDVGELLVRSTAQMDRYWDDPEGTAQVLVDGWLHTGDLARCDSAGRFQIAGRRREIYIRGGYNVAPAEVESVLAGHPAVAEVAVAARPSEVMGEIGVAIVVPRQGFEPPDLQDLRSFAGDKLAAWKLPEAILVVDELPLTAMAKVDRRALDQLVATTES